MIRYADGKPTALPFRTTAHMVAARYGYTLDYVRDEMAADDFLDALAFLGVTGGK